MKKIIISLSFILFVGIAMVSAQSVDRVKAAPSSAEKVTAADQKADSQVQVYYFHATRRCATCEAVEAETRKVIDENYGKKVSFESINNEEDKNNPLIEMYEISGQTLLVIKGDEVVDLTNEAFLNARTSPAKFEKKLKAAIDKLL